MSLCGDGSSTRSSQAKLGRVSLLALNQFGKVYPLITPTPTPRSLGIIDLAGNDAKILELE